MLTQVKVAIDWDNIHTLGRLGVQHMVPCTQAQKMALIRYIQDPSHAKHHGGLLRAGKEASFEECLCRAIKNAGLLALFTIAKTWKQPPGPTIDEWIKKMGRDFPGSPVVKTPSFQCRGCGFDP